MIDPAQVKSNFPLLVGQPELAYLDNAATSQKPATVLEAMDEFYRTQNGSVRRGVHQLSESATAAYEGARQSVARFIGAESAREVVFTRGTTSAINLVAQTWARDAVANQRSAIVMTEMEHHANYLPWLALQKETGCELRVIKMTDSGELDLDNVEQKLTGAGLLAVTHTSNVLGVANPIQELAERAHATGAKILVDAAQAPAHEAVDVQALQADFLVFSAHKMYGPTGIGVLWARAKILEGMRPLEYGGQMIKSVTAADFEVAESPWKFEAGTMPVAEAVGLAAAIQYLMKLGPADIHRHDRKLTEYALTQLADADGVTIYGPLDGERRHGLVSFTVDGVHPHDLATILADANVAIRSGHHCAAPLHARLGVPATARASWGIYNETADLDRLVQGIKDARKTLAR